MRAQTRAVNAHKQVRAQRHLRAQLSHKGHARTHARTRPSSGRANEHACAARHSPLSCPLSSKSPRSVRYFEALESLASLLSALPPNKAHRFDHHAHFFSS
eukprot:3335736-Pleurochrysis_carterae.AAC.2